VIGQSNWRVAKNKKTKKNELRMLLISSFSISYPDLIKLLDLIEFLYFADPHSKRGSGWKEAQRQGENRMITLPSPTWENSVLGGYLILLIPITADTTT
jgi:hypothetical protein